MTARSELQPQYKPAIAKKALFMVLAPALLSTGLLVYLNERWIDEGRIAEQQRKNYTIVAHQFFNMEYARKATLGLKNGVSAAETQKLEALIEREMALINQTARESDLSAKTVDIIDKLARVESKMLRDLSKPKPHDALRNVTERSVKLNDLLEARHLLYRSAGIAEAAESMFEAMDEEVRGKWQEQITARKQIVMSTWLVFLSILLIAILLVWRFSSDIVKRLNTLMNNAAFVGYQKQELSAVSGKDELAYLNSVLIVADEELKEAEEHRKSIMEMVAHDMRSPLMASQVSLDIVEELSKDSLPEKAQQGLLMAQRNLRRVLQFIEELLAIEKLQSGEVEINCEQFSVVQAVDECLDSLAELAQKRGIKLVNECKPMTIEADRRRIEQVLTNYISNAIKFSPENSEITISNESIDSYQRIAVKDHGRGMDGASCRKVFDKYFQTAEGRKKEGYGLGLAICRLLIEAHGGEVGATSELGKGSTFWLKVPQHRLPPVLAAQSAGSEASSSPDLSKDRTYKIPISFSKRTYLIDLRHPRILEKVLVCAVLPLIFQASMMLWINNGMSETKLLAEKEGGLYLAMHCVNYTVVALAAADLRLIKYFLKGDQNYRRMALADLAKCREKIAEFKQVIGFDKLPPEGQKSCIATLTLLNNLETHSASPLEYRYDNLSKLGQLMSKHTDQMDIDKEEESTHRYLVDNEEKLVRLSQQEQSERADVQTKIYLGIAANLLFATVLIVFFSLSVTKRLNILVKHAKVLPKRELIESTVAGEDELTYLDLILQTTSERLIEAAEHRRSVMQMVAHDMRSPMMAAQASIELLSAVHGESLPPVGRRHLPSAEKNIDRILHLVNDLLTLDKLEAGKLELDLSTCSVRQLADEAISTIASLASKRGVVVENQCEEIPVSVDAPRLNQVLANFISNGIKHSSANSVIKLVSQRDAHSISIGVRDQGPGLDKETAARVFDKFFQAEGAQKTQGFGLGLAICKLIVESHGGSVSVETAPGKGATFWLSLPRTKADVLAAAKIGAERS